jgi:tripartite-type tricarboxylate transporter receptor subunit TctC
MLFPTFLRYLAAILLAIASIATLAQPYPAKSIRLVVPFPPAGTPDILAREIGQRLTAALKQQIVIDNRPGAGGNIGADLVAKAPADGYTLLLAQVATHSINLSLYKNLPYHPIKDFAPVVLFATPPNVLVVNPNLAAKSVKELIALAKARPGKLTFGSGGNGTSHHLGGELFNNLTGVEMVHIPYKGAGQALPDLIGGQIDVMFDNLTSSLPHIRSGKLRALAVTGTKKRSPALPEVPTMDEAGVAQFDIHGWFGLVAPANTPQPIVMRLNQEVLRILQTPEMIKRLAEHGAEPFGSNTPEQFGAFLKQNLDKWAKIVKLSGAQID